MLVYHSPQDGHPLHYRREGLHRGALRHLDEAGKVQEVRHAAEIKVDLRRRNEGHHDIGEERDLLDQRPEFYPERDFSAWPYLEITTVHGSQC